METTTLVVLSVLIVIAVFMLGVVVFASLKKTPETIKYQTVRWTKPHHRHHHPRRHGFYEWRLGRGRKL